MGVKRHALGHFRRLRYAIAAIGGKASLDIESFEIQADVGGRQHTLYPVFAVFDQDRPRYTQIFSADSVLFCGWRPYRDRQDAQPGPDRLAVMHWLEDAKVRTPLRSPCASALPCDVVVKKRIGICENGVRGPFSSDVGCVLSEDEYCEQFIRGKPVRIWYWKQAAFCAEIGTMPEAVGDGQRSVTELALAMTQGRHYAGDLCQLDELLAYQGMARTTVPPIGSRALIDFRLDSRFTTKGHFVDMDLEVDGALPDIDGVARLGEVVWRNIGKQKGGQLFTADAIWDHDNRLWFVDIDIPTVVHPYAYAPMLRDLAAVPSQRHAVVSWAAN